MKYLKNKGHLLQITFPFIRITAKVDTKHSRFMFHSLWKNVAVLSSIICILQNCSKILLLDEQKKNFATALQKPGISSLQKKGIWKKIQEKCKKTPRCHNCAEVNGLCKIFWAILDKNIIELLGLE